MQYYTFTAEVDAEDLPPHIRPAHAWEVILKDPYQVHQFENQVEVAYYLGDSCQPAIWCWILVEAMIAEHLSYNTFQEDHDE